MKGSDNNAHSPSANERWLHVSIPEQRVWLKQGGEVLWNAPVSTARNGPGEAPESYCTPRGWHRIAEKIGDGEPVGTVFKARKPTGAVWKPGDPAPENLITTRILWLEGLEPANASTYSRYVYFHGTNREDLLGQPVSKGCVCLSNAQIVELFNQVETGMRVWIEG